MRSNIGITVHLFQMKSCTMMCCACRQSKWHHTAENIVPRSLTK